MADKKNRHIDRKKRVPKWRQADFDWKRPATYQEGWYIAFDNSLVRVLLAKEAKIRKKGEKGMTNPFEWVFNGLKDSLI